MPSGSTCPWLVLFLFSYLVLRHLGHVSMPWIFGEWCATGALVGLYALWNHLALGNYRQLLSFFYKSERGLGFRFAGESLLLNAWTYAAVYILILIFSLSVVGEIKLAAFVIGPMTVITSGLSTAMVAVAARFFATDTKKALRFVIGTGVLAAVICLLWTLAVYAVPVAKMTKILGPAWPGARALVPLTGLGVAILGMGGTVTAGLRSMRAAKENFRLAMAGIPTIFVLSIGGGIVWGVKAALAGACAGYLLYTAAALVLLVWTAHRLHPVSQQTDSADLVHLLLGTYP